MLAERRPDVQSRETLKRLIRVDVVGHDDQDIQVAASVILAPSRAPEQHDRGETGDVLRDRLDELVAEPRLPLEEVQQPAEQHVVRVEPVARALLGRVSQPYHVLLNQRPQRLQRTGVRQTHAAPHLAPAKGPARLP